MELSGVSIVGSNFCFILVGGELLHLFAHGVWSVAHKP